MLIAARVFIIGMALLLTIGPYGALATLVSGYNLAQLAFAWLVLMGADRLAWRMMGRRGGMRPRSRAILATLILAFPFSLFFYERSDGSINTVTTDRLGAHLTFPTLYFWAVLTFFFLWRVAVMRDN